MLNNSEAALEKQNTISDFYDAFSLTLLANLTGNPSISIPGSVNDDNKRSALQLIGQRFDDARLLALAGRVFDIYTGEMQYEI